MLSARLADKRIRMCHVERAFPAMSWPCLGCLVDHAMSFAKGSRTVVRWLSCIHWDRVMRLTGVKRSGLAWRFMVSSSQLSHTRELRNG